MEMTINWLHLGMRASFVYPLLSPVKRATVTCASLSAYVDTSTVAMFDMTDMIQTH